MIFAALISILTAHINKHGKCVDEVICREIAAYLNTLPFGTHYGDALYDFIDQYGEDMEDTYLGRDEDGEKQYLVHNPETNWHERIRKELIALGYYKRYEDAQRAA
jgi:hypothetical protein